jgi:Zn-dependent protease with chaperone function
MLVCACLGFALCVHGAIVGLDAGVTARGVAASLCALIGGGFAAAALRGVWCTALAPVSPSFSAPIVGLARSDVPELFAVIDDVAARCGIEPLTRLDIAAGCNAAIERDLSLWPRRRSPRLLVGLAMLDSLSREEFVSVVAHEFGHHRRDSLWMDALVRASVVVERTREGCGGLRLAWFADAWRRRAEPVQLALARDSEWAADALAREVSGVETVSHALVRVTLMLRVEAEIARRRRDRVGRRGPADADLLCRWRRRFDRRRSRMALLHVALAWRTRAHDSHPTLADRLRALGACVRLPPPLTEPASTLLGRRAIALRETLTAAAMGERDAVRTTQAIEASALAERLEHLMPAVEGGDPLATLECAEIAWRLGDPRAAVEPLRAAIAIAGSWPRLDYRLAVCLAELGDIEGFWQMLDLAGSETRYAADAAAWLAERYARDGDHEQANHFIRRHSATVRRSSRQGTGRPLDDATLLSAPTPAEQRLVALCLSARTNTPKPTEHDLWLVRSSSAVSDEGTLVIVPDHSRCQVGERLGWQAALEAIAAVLPADVRVTDLRGRHARRLLRRVARVGVRIGTAAVATRPVAEPESHLAVCPASAPA